MSGRGRGLRPGGVVRALMRFFLLVVLGFAAGLLIGVVSEEPELLAGHLRGESTSVSLSGSGADQGEAAPALPTVAAPPSREFASVKGQESTGLAKPPSAPKAALAPASRSVPVAEREPTPKAERTPASLAAPRPASGPASRPAPRPAPTPAPAPVPAALDIPDVVPEREVISAGSEAYAIQVGAFSDERSAQSLARGLGQKGYPAAVLPSAGSARRWRVRVQPVSDEGAAREMASRLKRDEGLPTWVLQMESGQGRSAR
ncbi:MAG: SPOR domain-containing protein [Myxococcota bacterium]